MKQFTRLGYGVVAAFLLAILGAYAVPSLEARHTSARGADSAAPCDVSHEFVLDDFNRPTKLEITNPDLCLKETMFFSYSPVGPHSFPYNSQTFVTADGLHMTLTYSRDPDRDHVFTYSAGGRQLSVSIDRAPFKPVQPQGEPPHLPAVLAITFNGTRERFVFAGDETDAALEAKMKGFLSVGRSAASVFNQAASCDRLVGFTKRFWTMFAGGDASKAVLPLKASFPATELTTNVFALCSALQDNAFYRSGLCPRPETLRAFLNIVAVVPDPKPHGARAQQPEPGSNITSAETRADSWCCWLCELAHCITDAHWADLICCFGSCYLPWI